MEAGGHCSHPSGAEQGMHGTLLGRGMLHTDPDEAEAPAACW